MSAERRGGAHRAELWPSIPAVLRVMAGWFLFGIGVLNLAVEVDGGLTGAYLVFHVVLLLGGILLLTRQRLRASRAGYAFGALTGLVGMVAGAVPDTSRCCLADHPERRGYPYPFLGTGDGNHLDPQYLIADLIFWGCAGLLVLVLVTLIERWLPERRVPVDIVYVARHAEPEIDAPHSHPEISAPHGEPEINAPHAGPAGNASPARPAGNAPHGEPEIKAGHAEPAPGARRAAPDAVARHAEPNAMAATPDRADENVGGLT